MKSKNIFYILIASIMCLLFAFTGCNGNTDANGGGGEDKGTYYTVTFDSRGGSAVESQRIREGNPAVRPQTPIKEGYYLTGWFKENDTEWNFDTDRVNDNITLYAGWEAEAQLPDSTASLTFEKEGNTYTVTDVGEETIVVIPAEHEGLPVTKIQGHHGTGAFAQKAFTSVTIPDTITEIGQNTFYGCRQLGVVYVGANSALTTIGNNAFSACSALKNITIPKGVTAIGNSAFNNCSVISFTVASGNTTYRSENGHLIESATQTLVRGASNPNIPDGVKVLEARSFQRTRGITELNIPKSVTKIGISFINESTITKINYAGMEMEWNAIEKSSSMWNYGNRDVQLVYAGTSATPDDTKVLIAYFSCTDTTKGVAESVQSQVSNSFLYRITPAVPYTADDLKYYTNCRADREQADSSARPEISGSVYNIEQYDVIFIGYPIWHGQAPKIIYTFLESYDFSGKTIIPFCTSASSPMGSSATNLHSLAPTANWKSGERISGNNVGTLIGQMN
ncbi:MAG: leucine-rich repeat protein [Clostridia bacterium]|nr:leucine-rich repeat protein [Clostridia bacterium]